MDSGKAESMTIRKCVGSGAVYGAMAWTIYAVVECWFTIILPWIIKPGYDYTPLHWGFTVLLFVIYPLIGLILGGFTGLFFKIAEGSVHFSGKVRTDVFLSSIAAFTVVLALSADYIFLLTSGFSMKHLFVPLVLSILLAVFMLSVALSRSLYERFQYISNPWTSCFLLLGVVWITRECMTDYSATYKAAASIVYPVMVLFIAFWIEKAAKKRRTPQSGEPAKLISVTRSFVITALIAVTSLGISFLPGQSPRIQNISAKLPPLSIDQPNVILIVMDTLRADHLPMYGYERDTAPNFRKFSEQATVYSRSFASGAMTLSTHASIFTGMYAWRHGAHSTKGLPDGQPLSDRFHTIAEVLHEKGYLTAGVVSNFGFLSHVFHMDQGFQYFDNRIPVHFLNLTRPYYLRHIASLFATRHFFSRQPSDVYKKAEEINSEVYSLLDRVKNERQAFFLFINYMDAHRPHTPPPPFDTLFPGKDGSINTSPNNGMSAEIMKLEREITVEERNHLISQYDGGIAYMDFHIGKLIDRLRELGLFENSLIIITSDHGEAFGERNLMEHGVSVYEDQVYVPLTVKFPNDNMGDVVDRIVNSVDIMPTILDVLGYDIPEDIQGESMLAFKRSRSRSVISESYPNRHVTAWHPRFNRVERAIFSWPYKFISSEVGKKELYDLSKDPDEKENLYQAGGAISRELDTMLQNAVARQAADAPAPVKFSSDALDRLKALGYVK